VTIRQRAETPAEVKKRQQWDAGEAPAPSARGRWLRVVRGDGVTLAYTTSRETAERLAAMLDATVTEKRVARRVTVPTLAPR